MSKKDTFYVEPRKDGSFAATREGGQRASVVADTQGQAIKEIKSMHSGATVHVARVRDVGPGPDKFRKV